MNAPNGPMSLYGFADASTDFDRRHPQWSAVMARLWDAMNLAFSRTQVMDTKIEKFVYLYGNLVAEDFMELFLMAVNGYGYGAMKLLRSMYEHTVTLRYLSSVVPFDFLRQHCDHHCKPFSINRTHMCGLPDIS